MQQNAPWLSVLFDEQHKQKPKSRHSNCYYRPPSVADMVRCAAGLPQAILKVTGFGHGAGSARAHFDYISRKGQLTLIDQDGHELNKEEQGALLKEWARDFGKKDNSRDTMKMVLSTPKGTQPSSLLTASAAFLHEEYGSTHPYVYTLHEDTNKPHVHVGVRMVDYSGIKLNPRKQYLYDLRKSFAQHCREQGILVEASPRFERGMLRKSKNVSLTKLREYKQQNPNQDVSQYAQQLEKKPSYYSATWLDTAQQWYQQAAEKLGQEEKKPNKQEQDMNKQAQRLLTQHAQSLQAARERAQSLEQTKSQEQACELES